MEVDIALDIAWLNYENFEFFSNRNLITRVDYWCFISDRSTKYLRSRSIFDFIEFRNIFELMFLDETSSINGWLFNSYEWGLLNRHV